MFVLRKITGSGIQSNICLNKVYNYFNTESNPEEVKKTLQLKQFKESESDKIYGFVVYDEGSKIEPLYMAQQNFIMMSDGKTFANISWR